MIVLQTFCLACLLEATSSDCEVFVVSPPKNPNPRLSPTAQRSLWSHPMHCLWRFVDEISISSYFLNVIIEQVLNARAAFLSNFEVLSLLRELDNEHISRARAAVRIKKEEDSGGHLSRSGNDLTSIDISENLRTVEVEVCYSLSVVR